MTEIKKFYIKEGVYGLELKKRFVQKRQLILSAVPCMNSIKDKDCFFVLMDTDGCILHISGNEAMNSKASEWDFKEGAFIHMNMQEHENDSPKNSDNSFVIYDLPVFINEEISGIIGVVFLKGGSTQFECSIKETVQLLSYSISTAVSINIKLADLSSKVKSLENIFDCFACAAAVFDMEGHFKMANKRALNIIGAAYDKEMDTNASKIIEQFEDMKKFLSANGTFKGRVRLNTLKGYINASIDASLIYDYSYNMPVIVCIIEEMPNAGRGFYYDGYDGRADYTFDNIIGEDPYLMKIIDYAKKIADLKSPLLITGETGSGKNMLAMSVHNWSSRMDENFIKVNCDSIPKELIDFEIFGSGLKKGKLEMADKGTLLLDHIENIPKDVQMKLVEFIENGDARRIGGSENIKPDVRIIALTSEDLKSNMQDGKFSKELYYRLNILSANLMPLRKRRGDIMLLVSSFTRQVCRRLNKKVYQYSPQLLKKIENYNWPGNVRELKNVIEKIVTYGTISEDYFDEGVQFTDINDENMKLDYIERQHIISVIKKCDGNITHAADALGIRRSTLYSKIKKFKIT